MQTRQASGLRAACGRNVQEENGMDISLRQRIMELPKQLADKIAAGEVVERPLSIVKELVENSIDAGADFITVEIRHGGKTYIRVTDNGCGIPKEEVELAFRRHATSKISRMKDLDAISTLGFRGEALASIAAVSRTEIVTKSPQETVGTSVINEGGVISSVSDTGCPDGMTIVVRDLFFNTPARLKFLKKDNTESSLIIDFISKIALAYPRIRVRMINNGNTLFTTPGRGDRFSAIATVYDPHTASGMIRVEDTEGEDFHLEGYISPPEYTKNSRRSQIFFVNGRYVQSKVLEKAVTDAYRQRLFEGRYPAVFLFLDVRPELLDVNIHPNKKEIRFDDDDRICGFVTHTIRQGLMRKEAVGNIVFRKDSQDEAAENAGRTDGQSAGKRHAENQKQMDIRTILREKRSAQYSEETDAAETKKDSKAPGSAEEEQKTLSHDTVQVSEESAPYGTRQENPESSEHPERKDSTADGTGEGLRFIPKIRPAEHIPFDVSGIRPVGTIFATYILGVSDDVFYMIDQHAAHERIFYDKLTREFYGQQKASQLIAVPIRIDVSHAVKNRESEWIGFLSGIGFDIEEFGPKNYAVKAFPAYMNYEEAEAFLNDFFDSLDDPGAFRDKRTADKIITRACKSAVKANDRLSPAEVEQLIRDLAAAANPFSCPHGRPTIIKMTRKEIEALFKR